MTDTTSTKARIAALIRSLSDDVLCNIFDMVGSIEANGQLEDFTYEVEDRDAIEKVLREGAAIVEADKLEFGK